MILEDQMVRSETQEIYVYIKDKNERKSFRDAQFISRRYMAITFQMGKKTGIQVRKQSKKYLHELKK